MAFTSKTFTAELDGITANELNKKIDRSLDSYEERVGSINDILDNTDFFNQYFDEYFNPVASQNDYLSLENNVCKVLENYATYLLNSRDIDDSEDYVYKFYYDEDSFKKALGREVLYNDKGQEVIDYLMSEQQNYKKTKEQKITQKDLRLDNWLGEVLRDYKTYLDYLNNENVEGQKFKVDKIKGDVKQDMILAKDSLNHVHGYNLRYFSESTEPNLDVIDFASFEQLKGFTIEHPDKNHRAVHGLLRMSFNGDFQNDFQCILYDLDKLIEKTPLTSREKEVLNFFRNGLTTVQTSDILGISQQSVSTTVDRAIKKVNAHARKLKWR